MFGTNEKTNFEGISTPKLQPAKYTNAEMTGVEISRPVKENAEGESEQLKARLVFTFKTAEGKAHQHIEYAVLPEDDNAEAKALNMAKRVGHIMSKFVAKDRLYQNHNNFDDYANWVVQTIGTSYKGVKVDFIVVGNVYNGKATSDFSKYLPFIVKAGDMLEFDKNHIKANSAYFNSLNAAPDTEVSSLNGGQKVDSDF